MSRRAAGLGFYVLVFNLIACSFGLANGLPAGHDSLKVFAVRIGTPPEINGRLDDPAWESGIVESRFTQRDPDELAAPTQRTEVIILYDDHALYVGTRMFDTAPDSIDVRLVRRDNDIETDFIAIYLDPYHDHRSGYYFGVNAAGTCLDGVRYNDTWADASWDGVWEGASALCDSGWCAEFRIPFSQFRFVNRDSMIWGINFKRWIGRRNEVDLLSCVPKNESGFVSRFWHLEGLAGIKQPRYFEVLPYVRGKTKLQAVDDADPFNHETEFLATGGADFKIGLGPNVILNATVNPDFGQVEVDPAVVNLSDVETYFSEKRPFFVEGLSIFDFGYGGATSYWSSNWPAPKFFYSRRIGRAPQSVPDNDYADVPEGVHIIGAGKFTAKLGKNWNVGSLHAVTMRETADIEYEGERSEAEVEPLTYYTVTRGQKDIQDGFRGVGGIFTGTHRFFKEERLKDDINREAFVGGMDGWSFLDEKRVYCLTGWLGLSHLQGTTERITSVQRSSRHYFQRPDASHVHVDSNATSLTGWAGRLMLSKEKGNWMMNHAVGVISPEFDSNDLGYMSRADLINTHIGLGYKWTKPTRWTQYADVSFMHWTNFDFGGNNTALGSWLGTYLQFPNYWSLNLSADALPWSVNNTRTRGGPLTLNRPGWETSFSLYSDNRRPVVGGVGSSRFITAADHWTHSLWTSVEWKPASNLSFSVGPELYLTQLFVQWVDRFKDSLATRTYGNRYVFAAIKQTELSASLRVNYTLTPKLSVQAYAQPLFSSGDYSDFRELSKPKSFDFYTYPAADVQYDPSADEYTIDPDGSGPAESFSFSNPDYDYHSLRGNIILRWEYRPGSALYLVWTHNQSYDESRGEFDLNRSWDHLFSTKPDNIFLIKATYWISG